MPTYEYACDNCGEQFDIFQSIKDAPATVCEKCGGHLTKLLSAGSGLIFKGSGFYITDYKTKSGGEPAGGGESKSSGSGESGGSGASSAPVGPASSPAPASGSTPAPTAAAPKADK